MPDQTDNLRQFARDVDVVDEETMARHEQSKKPTVIIPGGSMSISQSANTLYGHIAPSHRLFLRDGNVYQLLERHGQQVLEQLKPAAACSKFEEFVQFAKRVQDDEGKWKLMPTVLTKENAEKYLSAPGRELLPEIRGMINCPMIVERDGALHIVQSGYDAVTKLFVSGEVQLPEVTLEKAVFYLTGILQEFDFQTPGDRSRAIASLLTPALKFGGFLKEPIPADVAEADQSQAGKTHRQKITAALYNEEVNIVTKKEGSGVGSLEEGFGTALVEGRPFIQFDNVRGKLNSQNLESFFTATGRFPARPAYSRVVMVDPSKFMIFINSNGYQATPDLGNRSSIIRIKRRANHQYKDMLGFVKRVQPHLLSAVFKVMEEWHRQGKQRTGDTRHYFREWSQTLDWIVQNIFGEAPLMDGHGEAQQRVSSPDHTFLRSVAVGVAARNRLGHELKARDIFELCEESQIIIPGLTHEKWHDEDASNKVIGKIMARLFGEGDVVAVDAFEVRRQSSRDTSGTFSFPTKVYTFSRQPDSQPQGDNHVA